MKSSDPARKTIARHPSHLGSYRKAPRGSASASFASIGSIGGSTTNVMHARGGRAFQASDAARLKASPSFDRDGGGKSTPRTRRTQRKTDLPFVSLVSMVCQRRQFRSAKPRRTALDGGRER